MNNENIKTNATVSENVENDLLTEKTNYGTINSADLISGKAELVLMQPFDDGDSGISVACVGGDSGSTNTGSDNNYDCCDNGGSSSGGSSDSGSSGGSYHDCDCCDNGGSTGSDYCDGNCCNDSESCGSDSCENTSQGTSYLWDISTHISLNEVRDGYITSETPELWYKFWVYTRGRYTIHTMGDLDTWGELYDSNGIPLECDDDSPNGNKNFRITRTLQGGTTYYLRVSANNGETGCFSIRVTDKVFATSVAIKPSTISMNVGETICISDITTVYPPEVENKNVFYSSTDSNIIRIDEEMVSDSNCQLHNVATITALNPGIAIVRARDINNEAEVGVCEIWVRGKKPVILLHGRMDDTLNVWGAKSKVCGNNKEYNSNEEALISDTDYKYIDYDAQEIDEIAATHDEGGNLANYLTSADDQGNSRGYEKNINLFAFNYPNEDAVVHSARKLKLYIENLIDHVRKSGSDDMKICFYESREDYYNNNYKINIVAHSMGGLVARYYIENLGYDNHVDKLITVCTPHWGSGLADGSNIGGSLFDQHALCDHDISPNSVMFGFDDFVSSNFCYQGCPNNYLLTEELDFSRSRNSRYYAIAGIDNPHLAFDRQNDKPFVVPDDKQTYNSLGVFLGQNGVVSLVANMIPSKASVIEDLADINEVARLDDNVVGFLSQIGWTGDGIADLGNLFTPTKKVPMEEIFVNADTNGGNPVFSFSFLHIKIPHRESVMKQIELYLNQ